MAYSNQLWAMVRSLYMTGQFKSLAELHKSCTEANIKVPSIDAIKKRAGKEGWDKHGLEDEIKQTQEERIKELFAKHGMGEENVIIETVGLIKDYDDKPYVKKEGIKLYMDMTGTKAVTRVDATTAGEKLNTDAPIFILPDNGYTALVDRDVA